MNERQNMILRKTLDAVVGALIAGSEMSLCPPLRALNSMALGLSVFDCGRKAALVRKSNATEVPEALCSGLRVHFSCLPLC
jgi:hypothetical protein